MAKSDLIGCVIDYITQLEDELLEVMDFGSDLRLEDDESSDSEDEETESCDSTTSEMSRNLVSSQPNANSAESTTTTTTELRTPLKTLDNLIPLVKTRLPNEPSALGS